MSSRSEDPAELLRESGQWTEPWTNASDQARCAKCAGTGQIVHECWSCLLTGAADSCPVCSGKMRWEGECPVCRGTGEIDRQPRRGVRVFPTVEALYYYMLTNGTVIDESVIVELDGELAADADFDADQGAVLVIPTAIRGCAPADRAVAERIAARTRPAA